MAELERHATGDAADVPGLVRLALDAGELAEARGWLSDLTTSVAGERARREATRALDRARNRGVTGDLVAELEAAVARGDSDAIGRWAEPPHPGRPAGAGRDRRRPHRRRLGKAAGGRGRHPGRVP